MRRVVDLVVAGVAAVVLAPVVVVVAVLVRSRSGARCCSGSAGSGWTAASSRS